MAVYGEGRGMAAEAEPFGLLTEGAAGNRGDSARCHRPREG